MRRFLCVENVLGALATAAMLLLLSPGVRVVHADGGDGGQSQCQAEAARAGTDAQMEAFLAELRREQFARQVEGDTSAPVMLNSRGYNYGPPPGIQIDPVMADVLRQGRPRAHGQ